MPQFKTARLAGSTPMSSVDTHVNDLEAAVVYAFGFETSGPMTGPVMNVDIDGNVVDIVRSAAAPVPASNTGPGWRMRDTTNNTEYMIMPVDNYLNIYKNTGSQASPTWVLLAGIDNVNGQWNPGGDYSSAIGVKDIYGTVDFRTEAAVQWNALAWQVSGVDVGLDWSTGQRTRLICNDAGEYMFHFNVYYHPGVGQTSNNTEMAAHGLLNGTGGALNGMVFATAEKTIVGSTDSGLSLQGSFGADMALNDYVEIMLTGWGSGDYDGTLLYGGIMGNMVGRS